MGKSSITKTITKFEIFFWFILVLGILRSVEFGSFKYYPSITKYGVLIGGIGIILLKFVKLRKI